MRFGLAAEALYTWTRQPLGIVASGLHQRYITRPMSVAGLGQRGAALSPAAAAATPRPRVAVIGAGFAGAPSPGAACHSLTTRPPASGCCAGLAAALALERSRCYDVVVLEAGRRAGGRACTLRVSPELAFELGATWFHGLGDDAEPNPVFRHALELGLIDSQPAGERRLRLL